jgi:selenide,water dikinase
MYQKGESTGSNKANRRLSNGFWKTAKSLTAAEEELLFDPQTSGGLLLSVPAAQGDDLLAALKKAGVDAAAHVGEVVEGQGPFVKVV